MSFTNPAPLGGYVTGNQITEAEINYWCGVLPDAIDGASGGTYTLSNPLVIDGDTVDIETLTSDDADITALVVGSVTGNLGVTGNIVAGGTMISTGGALVGGTLGVNGSLGVNGGVSVGGILSYTGVGRALETLSIISASATVDISTYRNISIIGSTAAQTLTIAATGLVDGDWCIISNISSQLWNITAPGGFANSIGAGQLMKLIRSSGTWAIFYRILS